MERLHPRGHRSTKTKILICDDNPSIRDCLQAFLEMRGDEVTTSADTAQAWFALSRELILFDVLVCDGLNGDGPRLLRAVRNHHPRIRTVLFSATDELVEKEKALGCAAVLKGDTWAELLAAIGQAAGVPR